MPQSGIFAGMKRSMLVINWLLTERAVVLKIYFLVVIQALLYISIPVSIQGIYTFIMTGQFSASLVLLCTITIFAVAFIGFLDIWQMRLNETLYERIFCTLTTGTKTMLGSQLGSDRLSRINKFAEVSVLQKGAKKILLDLSFSVLSIIFGIIILPVYSTWFLLFTIFLCIAFWFIISYFTKRAIDTNIETSNVKYRLIEGFQKSALKPGQDVQEHTDQTLDEYLIRRKSHYKMLESQAISILVFKIIFIAILLLFGAYLVHNGSLNIGQFIASEIIVFMVINSVEKLINSLSTYYDMTTALYKIEGMLRGSGFSFMDPRHKKSGLPASLYVHNYSRTVKWFFYSMLVTGMVLLFMPWTQNISTYGKVTALNPQSLPQTVTSRISGRIEKWYISDGDFVNKNDTIAYISEIKDEYIDPQLIERSESQIKAKETSILSYEQKINAIDLQINALNNSLRLKVEQARNKIKQALLKVASDSAEAKAAENNLRVSEDQFKRYQELVAKGIISKTELENRNLKVQEAIAKHTSALNKYASARNDFMNAEIELNNIQQEYQEKLMKAESDKFSSLSLLYDSEASVTKLQNQLAGYSIRRSFYYVLAPQSGYVTKTDVQGIGEIIKEGGAICNIVPLNRDAAVELYINPIDLPLITKGQRVQLEFDGWPAFVFSGWPGISYGTFQGEIVSFDRVISENGKFRLLAIPKGANWPEAVQMGCGVKGHILLKNVPVAYELWRKINGFPPDFYNNKTPIKNGK